MKAEYRKVMHETVLALMSCRKEDVLETLEVTLSRAAKIFDAEDGYVYILNNDSGKLEGKVGLGSYSSCAGDIQSAEEGFFGQVLKSGQPSVKQDGSEMQLAAPMAVDGEVLGIIGVAVSENYIDERDRMFLGELGALAAAAVKTAKGYMDLYQQLAEGKKAEAAMQKSLVLLHAAVEATVEGLLIIDNKNQICSYNQKFQDIWRMPGKIVDTQNSQVYLEFVCTQLKHPEVFTKGLAEFVRRPKRVHYYLLELRDGRYLECRSQPQWSGKRITGRVLNFRDVTKHKLDELALLDSEEKFRLLADNTPYAVALMAIDGQGLPGQFLEINDVACRGLAISKEQALRMSAQEILANESICSMLPKYNKQDSWKRTYLYECLYRAPDGRQIPMEINLHRFVMNGQLVSMVIAKDLTENKRMEKEMARLDRLNLVGEMAAGIGHEVRNPMTTVRGFLQMMLNKTECSIYHKYYQIMIEELDRANSIITEFLSMAKDKAISLRPSNLNHIITALVPLIEADALVNDKNISVELTEIASVLADEKEIRQLILNLARNGLEAMSSGGYITIQTFMEQENVVLAVQDQGKGIAANILEKIGTPFFTTKENGTGLGLAVCYSIAARHSAVIDIHTSQQGTIFYVKFNKAKK